MLSSLRAGLLAAVAAACLAVACFAAAVANKPFTNDDLTSSAVELEAQIKSDAGTATKPVDQLKRDADAAFAKNDFRTGMAVLDQIVAAAPNDAGTWLRLAHTIQQIRPGNDNERAMLLERASSAAYIAYQRATDRNQEADSLAFLGTLLSQRQIWRPALDALRLSLELRETADVRGQYERLRDQYGFRVLDYTVDADTASPRACFQFSEDIPARTDFSPFVALAGTDKPALSVTEKQLCVEGLDARPDLYSHAARRPAVGGARDAVEIVGLRHLCARPQTVRAVLDLGLCAAAHRPAGHSGHQRQYQIRRGRNLSHQRPQSDRHDLDRRFRQRRFPEQSEPLRRAAIAEFARRPGLEGHISPSTPMRRSMPK